VPLVCRRAPRGPPFGNPRRSTLPNRQKHGISSHCRSPPGVSSRGSPIVYFLKPAGLRGSRQHNTTRGISSVNLRSVHLGSVQELSLTRALAGPPKLDTLTVGCARRQGEWPSQIDQRLLLAAGILEMVVASSSTYRRSMVRRYLSGWPNTASLRRGEKKVLFLGRARQR